MELSEEYRYWGQRVVVVVQVRDGGGDYGEGKSGKDLGLLRLWSRGCLLGEGEDFSIFLGFWL